jgi:hypothetical protein
MDARKPTWGGLLAALVLLSALGSAGCKQKAPALPSVDELAASLRAHGVAYTVAETAALPRVRAQGLRLTGEGLEVDLYRFDDDKELKLAATAAQMARAASARPMQAIVRGPFLAIVRSEPTAGQVAAALAQALPE